MSLRIYETCTYIILLNNVNSGDRTPQRSTYNHTQQTSIYGGETKNSDMNQVIGSLLMANHLDVKCVTVILVEL